MFSLIKPRSLKSVNGHRQLWQYLNIIFNRVDEKRRAKLGPDRTCAEWLLRNGAQVMWTTSTEYFNDYNGLPPEDENVKLYIKSVDATDSSINHHGFPHFVGCKHVEKVILHKCIYIENDALPLLQPLNETLRHLQVSSCGNVDETGLNSLASLTNLNNLTIFDLPYAEGKKENILKSLKERLPNCNITFK